MPPRLYPALFSIALALGACAPQEMIARYGDGGVAALPVDSAYPESPDISAYPDPMLPAAVGAAPSPWPTALSPPGVAGSTARSHMPVPVRIPRRR